MTTGDKVFGTRPRAESNERLDLVDWDRMSLTAQLAMEAVLRAIISSPRATAGVPTGERWTGSITANPTSGSDGLVRLDSAVFVGLDANGGLVLKPNGTTLSIAIPSGGADYQVYAYIKDIAEDTQLRRKLPATSPFNEFAAALNTALRATVDLYVRAGSAGSVVAQDTVSGFTKPLLFLGIANNTAGNVVFTPAANMLETVSVPATGPTTNTGTTTSETTTTGGASTLRELINFALYQVGQIAWKGSSFVTPAAGNNYGAYLTPAGGVDAAYRGMTGWLTIGNGTTVVGDFNTSDYGNAKLCLDAAIAALPAQGGTIILKKGVVLSGFGGSTVTMPAGKTIEIIGDHTSMPANVPQIVLTTGEKLITSATGKLTLRNLHVRQTAAAGATAVTLTTSPFTAIDCFFENTATANTGADLALLQGTNVSDVTLQRCRFETSALPNTANGTAVGLKITGTAYRIYTKQCSYKNSGGDGCGLFSIADCRNDVVLEDTVWTQTGGLGATGIALGSTDNTTDIYNRRVVRYNASGEYSLVWLMTSGVAPTNFLIDDMQDHTANGQAAGTSLYQASMTYKNCSFKNFANFNVGCTTLSFRNCEFLGTFTLGDGVDAVYTWLEFIGCTFVGTNYTGTYWRNTITANTIFDIVIKDCTFKDYAYPTAADWAIFTIQVVNSNVIYRARLTDNRIDGVQNTAYSGGDATTSPRIFDIRCELFQLIDCSRNTITRCMSSFSGNSGSQTYLLRVDTPDVADTSAVSGTILMHGNNAGQGDTSNNLCLLKTVHVVVDSVSICRNNIWTRYQTAAGTPQFREMVNMIYPAAFASTGREGIVVDDNYVRIENSAAANLTKDLFFFGAVGVPTFSIFSFQRNSIHLSTEHMWVSPGYGFSISGAAFRGCSVVGNMVIRGATSNIQIFSINHGTFNFTYFPSHAPAPSVNSQWATNNGVYRGPT